MKLDHRLTDYEYIYGQEAIDRYDTNSSNLQLTKFIGKGLYEECSLMDAQEALKTARGLGLDFILGDPERAVMLEITKV